MHNEVDLLMNRIEDKVVGWLKEVKICRSHRALLITEICLEYPHP